MHQRQAHLLNKARRIASQRQSGTKEGCNCGGCGDGGSQRSLDNAVWQDPSSYDMVQDGPPYMPVKIASSDLHRVRLAAKNARPKAVTALNRVSHILKAAGLSQPPVELVEETEGREAAMKARDHQPLADLLALYRAAAAIHQSHHWQTRGSHYYSDHLLFQRIYEETSGLIDGLAERTVGLGHWILVDVPSQSQAIAEAVRMFSVGGYVRPQEMIRTSYNLTVSLRSAIQLVIDRLTEKGIYTAGLDDLLPANASTIETHGYLLGQRLV